MKSGFVPCANKRSLHLSHFPRLPSRTPGNLALTQEDIAAMFNTKAHLARIGKTLGQVVDYYVYAFHSM